MAQETLKLGEIVMERYGSARRINGYLILGLTRTYSSMKTLWTPLLLAQRLILSWCSLKDDCERMETEALDQDLDQVIVRAKIALPLWGKIRPRKTAPEATISFMTRRSPAVILLSGTETAGRCLCIISIFNLLCC